MSSRKWVVMVLGLVSGVAAQADMAAVPSPVESQALACLQRGSRTLSYSAADLEERKPGTLRYRLRFVAPDRPPEATLIFRSGTDAMVAEVEAHVRDFRLLLAGTAAALAQAAPCTVTCLYRDKPVSPV